MQRAEVAQRAGRQTVEVIALPAARALDVLLPDEPRAGVQVHVPPLRHQQLAVAAPLRQTQPQRGCDGCRGGTTLRFRSNTQSCGLLRLENELACSRPGPGECPIAAHLDGPWMLRFPRRQRLPIGFQVAPQGTALRLPRPGSTDQQAITRQIVSSRDQPVHEEPFTFQRERVAPASPRARTSSRRSGRPESARHLVGRTRVPANGPRSRASQTRRGWRGWHLQ